MGRVMERVTEKTSKSLIAMIYAVVFLTIFMGSRSEAATNYSKRADEIMQTMTQKELVAQMFLIQAPVSGSLDLQKKNQFGGYVFFENDFSGSNVKKFKERTKNLQAASKVKMFLAVDEEGGKVTRVSSYKAFRSSKFASPRTLYKKGKYTAIKSDTKKKAKLLQKIGLNTNLAPVADVPYSSRNYIYPRSFSTSAKKVAKYITTVVSTMGSKKEVSCLKHFPGYGNNKDTHSTTSRDKRSLSTLQKRDLLPFAAGIKAGCDMIMVSHNIVDCLDRGMPASLSSNVHSYLRNNMGYNGIIVTDSLDMKGVAGYAGNSKGEVAVKAVLAGNDLLCTSSYDTQFKAVLKAVQSGRISEDRIKQSVKRILICKLKRGIIY